MSETSPAETSDDIMLGPIDYLVVEYADGSPSGEALPHLVDLVERGIVRIIDVALIANGADTYTVIRPDDLVAAGAPEFDFLAGVATGLLSDDDLGEISSIMGDGAAAVVLVYENSWAAPLATAMRRAGGQMIASGRIPAQDVLDALAAAPPIEDI